MDPSRAHGEVSYSGGMSTVAEPSTDLPAPTASYAVDPALVRRLTRRVVCAARPELRTTSSPLTGGPVAELPLSTADDVALAYAAATAAQRRWAALPVRRRGEILLRLHDLVLDHQEQLLDLVQLESGKARSHAFEEVADVAIVCRHYARVAANHLAPRTAIGVVPGLSWTRTAYLPVGVVGIVSPWNYPLTLAVTDALAAMMAGNAVVLRPDLQTSLTALYAADLLAEAGLPEGVLQVVIGSGSTVGQAVLDTCDYVCFTGSTATGRAVAERAGRRLVGMSLELGGKNGCYVRADADLDLAVDVAVRSSFASAGQLCMHTERLILDESIAEDFLARFIPAVEALRVGVGLTYGVDMGSLLGAEQLGTVQRHVDDARTKGALVLTGGTALPELGPYVYAPTVLDGVTSEMLCRNDETFGPVVSIYRVGSDEEALTLMNDTEYGLHGTIVSRDTRRAGALANRIRTGSVSINDTYAVAWGSNRGTLGGMKASGIGRRHGKAGLLRFTEQQNVTTQRLHPMKPVGSMTDAQFASGMTAVMRVMKKAGLS